MAFPLMIMAQTRIGVVNSAEVFNAMPDKVKAEQELQQTSATIKAEVEHMQDEFNTKFADYQEIAADSTIPATIRERRIQELHNLDSEIQSFISRENQNIEQTRNELMEPILAKIQAAIEQVSEEEGMAIVFDTAKVAVAYTGPYTEDITPMVKARLGLPRNTPSGRHDTFALS